MKPNSKLPVVDNCTGCGVCCLHMGYPAFMLPREKATETQIDSQPEVRKLLAVGWTRSELLSGHEGEQYWHGLPMELKNEWLEYVQSYTRENELDGPCFWLDRETRKCRHHEFRPNVCRDLRIGSQLCRQWRIHYRELIHSID